MVIRCKINVWACIYIMSCVCICVKLRSKGGGETDSADALNRWIAKTLQTVHAVNSAAYINSREVCLISYLMVSF